MSWMHGVLFLAICPLAACFLPQGDEEAPGELVAYFDAAGTIIEQSCGAGVPAQDPLDLTFEVRLEESGRAYWIESSGASFTGTGSNDEYTFQVSQSFMLIPPDSFRGYAGCSVTQRDLMTLTIEEREDVSGAEGDDPADPEDFTRLRVTGSQVTEVMPLQGSDCRAATLAFGGNFLSMPCRIEYLITGQGI